MVKTPKNSQKLYIIYKNNEIVMINVTQNTSADLYIEKHIDINGSLGLKIINGLNKDISIYAADCVSKLDNYFKATIDCSNMQGQYEVQVLDLSSNIIENTLMYVKLNNDISTNTNNTIIYGN